MQSLSKQLAAAQLPDLHGPNLWVSSGYVIENKNAEFNAIAVLLAVPECSEAWQAKRVEVRSSWQEKNELQAPWRQSAFSPFLNAADSPMPGGHMNSSPRAQFDAIPN